MIRYFYFISLDELSCLKHLGNQHQNLAVSLVPELLSTHPFFATSEPDVDDPAYVGMVVIVLNAALNSPTIVPILPSHTRRHYPYLRDQYPELLPEISLDDTLKRTWAAPGYAYPVGQDVGMCFSTNNFEHRIKVCKRVIHFYLKTYIRQRSVLMFRFVFSFRAS